MSKDLFDGQMSMFAMDDTMGFETIGITDGGDEFFEEVEVSEAVPTEEKIEKTQAPAVPEVAAVKKVTLPKLKIEGVFPCMGCGKLLTKTVTGDKFKATCNTCNVSYSGNN